MKSALVLALLLIFTAPCAFGEAITFESFKALPQAQRDAMMVNEKDPLQQGQFFVWHWRLAMGEKSWQEAIQQRLIDDRGFAELENYFLVCEHLHEYQLLDQGQRRSRLGRPRTKASEKSIRAHKILMSLQAQYQETEQLVSTVAPTEEARALNKEAEATANALLERFPEGKRFFPTSKDMLGIDKTEQKIREQLKALPKLTPEQVQAEIDALPMGLPWRKD